MKKILIPFDFRKPAINAFEYALDFASEKPQTSILLLFTEADEKDNRKKLEDFIKSYKKARLHFPEVELLFKPGKWIDTTIAIHTEKEIDLVIVGTRGAKASENGLVTQTSEFVQRADLPVLIVPENTHNFRLDTIILAVGKDKIADRAALNTLLEVSRRFNAKVHVLTVEKDSRNSGFSENDELNENTIQYFLELFYSHHSFMENDDIEKGINQYLEANSADMLAILPNTHLDSGKASGGKLTRALTLHAERPLLVLD